MRFQENVHLKSKKKNIYIKLLTLVSTHYKKSVLFLLFTTLFRSSLGLIIVSGGYRKQMERNMERAVSRGQMVPAEFHRKKAEMLESLASGVDDGRSKTSGLTESAS